jgi:hypothetical protein
LKAGRGTPPPVFFVRVASKGLMLDAASRFANTELERVGFLASCKGLAPLASARGKRAAGKGVRQGIV